MQLSPFAIAGIVGVIGLVIILVVVFRKKSGTTTPVKDVGISKPGNNGSVSCQEYCVGPYTGVQYKKAVSATLQRTGQDVPVTHVPGAEVIPGSNPPNYGYNALTCMCSNN